MHTFGKCRVCGTFEALFRSSRSGRWLCALCIVREAR